MKQVQTSSPRANHSLSFRGASATPADVFYVVQTTGAVAGERSHCLRSDLYETRLQADGELARLSGANPAARYGIWKSSTYIEPAEWLHRVVRADGSLILPRLDGVGKHTNA